MASPADTLGFSIPGLVISGVYSLMQGLAGGRRPVVRFQDLGPRSQIRVAGWAARGGIQNFGGIRASQGAGSGAGSGAATPPIGGTYRTAPTPKNPDFERMMGREVGGKAKAKPPRRPKIRTGGTAADKLGRRGWGWRDAGKWLGRRIFIPPWLRKLPARIPPWVRVGSGQVAVIAGSILVAEELTKVIFGVEPVTTPPIKPTPTPPARPAAPRTYPQPPPVAAPAPATVVITEEMPAPVTWLPPVPKPKPAPWYQRALQAVQPWLPLILPLALPKSKGAKAPVTNISFGSQTDTRPFADPLTAFYSGGVASTRTGKQCECKPKRKRKPKDRRKVCYRGTYIETPTGLRKRRGKRVSCRPSSAKPASRATR